MTSKLNFPHPEKKNSIKKQEAEANLGQQYFSSEIFRVEMEYSRYDIPF